MNRPNILFLMSDEHRADVSGFAGNPVVRTPFLDQLARSGAVFNNAYTASPICVPGRQCLMSGQLPKTNGCEGWKDLPPFTNTFASQFAKHAYHTVCVGKLHHEGPDQMQGWTQRPYSDTHVAPNAIEGFKHNEASMYAKPEGTGKWSNQKEIVRAGIGHGPYQIFDQQVVNVTNQFIHNHWVDSFYDRPAGFRPTLLKVSLLQPHYPYLAEEEKFDYYLNRVSIYNEETCDHPVLSFSQQHEPVEVSQRDIRRCTAAYYAMIEKADEHFMTVVNELEKAGHDLDDWIIIYTSDHGEMLGQHGIWEKTRFYEASVKVPLIIRWPKGFEGGIEIDENVNLCDLYATLCELAGIEIPDGLDSRSLVPLLNGESNDWSNESISQYGSDHVMIKQDHLKYQYYGDAPEVLFDLEKDPSESINYIDTPSYQKEVVKFRERLATLGHGPNAQKYINAGY
ncbi:MAG: sulfatase-like hydrolase/transferase [Lentisphaeria bacterium]|nr:sulfatase-like hydrolase/transferase [Lentisphaeria bacterium]